MQTARHTEKKDKLPKVSKQKKKTKQNRQSLQIKNKLTCLCNKNYSFKLTSHNTEQNEDCREFQTGILEVSVCASDPPPKKNRQHHYNLMTK